ncbi:hypothetical protein F7725_005402 [Dissostichus mawsoni]|uniref:Sushi domain-containing protein n=1 Tax=Dissostichus mawsoni TaxID=36200 RepID=A0A7J5YU88_DISMA|nr:hypothetical protein F7725_005402 [Dissostichus mawsoni]
MEPNGLERTEKRLYISTKNGTQAAFVSAISICVFYHLCLRPELAANIEMDGLQRFYSPGVELVLSCKQGYTQFPALGRLSKRCPHPDPLSNGELYYEDTVFQSMINYTCDEGYIMNGDRSAVCLADGTWSTPVPECKPVTCDLAPIPPFGMIVYDKRIRGDTVDYGVGGTYKCNPPYIVVGKARAECTVLGTWTKTPECQVVTCPLPENIDRGFMSSSEPRDYDYRETIKYGCNGDYVLKGSHEIVCQQNGNWSEKPSCQAPCSVGIETARILYKGKKIWIKDLQPNRVLHNDIVSVYCMDKPRKCGYAVQTQCINGKLKIPECFERNMAALYEGYTLCGLTPSQNLSNSGIQGVEPERDSDHVVVTDSRRSVTLFKVSDQKSLSKWTVKQGQTLTCSAVYNSKTKEYVAVSDSKVIRIWKEEDIHLDKAFKATRGAVRFLDSLLSAPKQPIEDVLAQEEAIRWSTNVVTESQQFVIFTTEQKGDNFLYLQRFNPNTLQKYRLEREEPGLSPSASLPPIKTNTSAWFISSLVPVRGLGAVEGAPALPLPRSLLLALPVGEGLLEAASVQVLDEAHVAVVGLPHPSAGAGKDFLCIWNTNFQTLQAGKEMAGKIYGQLWGYSNKLFIPHGKSFSVIPYECPKSSLASALGKLRQAKTEESKASTSVPSWNNILHEDKANPSKTVETRKTRTTRKSQSAPSLTNDQIMELIKTASVAEVQTEVEGLLSRTDVQDLQPSLGQLAAALVSRSLGEEAFYTPSILAQLVQTRCLCHSMCPDLVLLALEKKDYFLCQLCLQFFPDIPEAVSCACLKTFISMPDSDAEKVNLEPESISLMETLMAGERDPVGLQNGFSPATNDMDQSGGTEAEKKETTTPPEQICPVGLHKAFPPVPAVPLPKIFPRCFPADAWIEISNSDSDHGLGMLAVGRPFHSASDDSRGQRLTAHLHTFVKSQVKLFSELGKIEGSLHELNKMKVNKDIGQYSIEVIELF